MSGPQLLPERQCVECGADFTPRTTWQRFDTAKCRDRYNGRLRADARRALWQAADAQATPAAPVQPEPTPEAAAP
jgi:hypothetical protein